MSKEEQLSKTIENYQDKKDWVSIDILCQRALGIEEHCIESNLRLIFPDDVGFKNKLTDVNVTLTNIGFERYLDDSAEQFILKEIDEKVGETLREKVVGNIKNAHESVANGLYLFAHIWSKKPDESNIELNKLYYATFGKDPSFDFSKELVALGVAYHSTYSSRKNYWWYYKVPHHISPILQNINEYITPPKILDASSYIKLEEQSNNIQRLMFLDLSTRKVNQKYVDETPNLKDCFNLHYPDGFDDASYSKAGIVYVDEYSRAYFSPITFDKLKNEIGLMKQRMAEPLKNTLLKVVSRLEKKYPIAQRTLRFDNRLGVYVGTIDVGTRKPVGVFISPWVLWVDESYPYPSEICYDLNWIKNSQPSLIITSDKIRPSVIRNAIHQGYKNISFISVSEGGNYLLSIGNENQLVTELLPIFAEIGYHVENITDKVLSKMFPFTKEDIFDFANIRFIKEGLIDIANQSGLSISKSMLKDDMLQALCDHLGLRGFAEKIGYPLFEPEQTEKMVQEKKVRGDILKPQETEKIIPLYSPIEPVSISKNDSIIIGSKDLPKQYGIVGLSSEKKVIIDLNAPHIVFVSGMMGSGKGYTIGTISEMLVSNQIPNISNISKKATIIVLYKPRDDVPSEFWSIRYPNDIQKEIEKLGDYGARPMAPITENQFRVFIDPNVFVKHLDTFKSEYKTPNVYPLYIDPSTLISDDWANALAAGESEALYVKKIYKIFRELPANFGMDDIINCINASDMNKGQKDLAKARLEILGDYLKKEDFVSKLIIGGVNIVDFRKAMYQPVDIFTIMTIIMSKLQNKKEFEYEPFVFIMNEAHLFFKGGISEEFVTSIENLIRRKRHGANWLLMDTHLPEDVDSKVIKLSDMKFLHFTDKTVDSPILKRILEGTDVKLSKLNIGEAIVCANESSLGLSIPIHIQVRARLSKHGGATKTAIESD